MEAWDAFLALHANGIYAELARLERDKLTRKMAAPPPLPPAAAVNPIIPQAISPTAKQDSPPTSDSSKSATDSKPAQKSGETAKPKAKKVAALPPSSGKRKTPERPAASSKKTQQKAARQTSPGRSGGNCMTFNGKRFC
jgi:hypothetical protein